MMNDARVDPLRGYTLVHESDRDFAIFDATTGIPAQCLRANPVQTGREQLFQRANQGRVRVDSIVFESPGQAASAARAAALMINNATEKMPDAETVGDASWRTVAGSPAFIVQSVSVLFYIA